MGFLGFILALLSITDVTEQQLRLLVAAMACLLTAADLHRKCPEAPDAKD